MEVAALTRSVLAGKLSVENHGQAGQGYLRSKRPSRSWTNCCSSMAALSQCKYVESLPRVVSRRTAQTNIDSCGGRALGRTFFEVGIGTFFTLVSGSSKLGKPCWQPMTAVRGRRSYGFHRRLLGRSMQRKCVCREHNWLHVPLCSTKACLCWMKL